MVRRFRAMTLDIGVTWRMSASNGSIVILTVNDSFPDPARKPRRPSRAYLSCAPAF
jgi:hypothetical protein